MIILIFTYTYPFHTIRPVRYILNLRIVSRIKKSLITTSTTGAFLTRIRRLLLFHFMIHYSVAKLTCPVLIYIVTRKILHNHYVAFRTTQLTFILYIYYFLHLYPFTMIYGDSTVIHSFVFLYKKSVSTHTHTHTTYLTLAYLVLLFVAAAVVVLSPGVIELGNSGSART
jgi:hypothetical protein